MPKIEVREEVKRKFDALKRDFNIADDNEMIEILCVSARLVKDLANIIAFLSTLGKARARRKIQ